MVAETYRQKGHSKSDANRYRSKEEMNEWLTRDPVPRFRADLLDAGMTEDRLGEIEAAVGDELERAVAFAQASEFPPIDSILEDVYA